MKKLFLFIGLIPVLFAEAQYPSTIQSGNTSTLQKSAGGYGAYLGFAFTGSFGDTTAANLSFVKNVPGHVIRVGDSLWMRNNATTKWMNIGRGAGAPLVHTHVPGDIIGLTTYVRNLFSAGSGLVYNSSTGQFSYPGAGGGITEINGLTDGVQTLEIDTTYSGATGWSSVGSAHTLRLNSRLFTGSSGNTNSNIGSGFRFAVPGTNNIKTLFNGYAINIDSASNTNGLTLKADTTLLLTKLMAASLYQPVGSYLTSYTETDPNVATIIKNIPVSADAATNKYLNWNGSAYTRKQIAYSEISGTPTLSNIYNSDGQITDATRQIYAHKTEVLFRDSSSFQNFFDLEFNETNGLGLFQRSTSGDGNKQGEMRLRPNYFQVTTEDFTTGRSMALELNDSSAVFTGATTDFQSDVVMVDYLGGFSGNNRLVGTDGSGHLVRLDSIEVDNVNPFVVYGETLGTYWGQFKAGYDGGMAINYEGINPYTPNKNEFTLSPFSSYNKISYDGADTAYLRFDATVDSAYAKYSIKAYLQGGTYKEFIIDPSFYQFKNLASSSDTTTYKPGGYDANGKLVRMNYWPGGGGGGFSVTNETDNRIITSSGTGTGNAESDLTFTGGVLTLGTVGDKINLGGIDLGGNLNVVGDVFFSGAVVNVSNSFVLSSGGGIGMVFATNSDSRTITLSPNSTSRLQVSNETAAFGYNLKATGTLGITGDLDVGGRITMPEIAAPSTPASGFASLYVKSDGLLYWKDDAGVEHAAGGGGSGDLLAANNLSELTNYATARTNLGLAIGTNVQAYDADLTTYAGLTPTTVGQNLITAVNPSAVKWIRINADNTISLRSAAETISDLGALTSVPTLAQVSTAGNSTTNQIQTGGYSWTDGTNQRGSLGTTTIVGTTVGLINLQYGATNALQVRPASLTGTRTAIFPDADITVLGEANTATVTNKTYNAPTIGTSGTAGSAQIKTVGSVPTVSMTGAGTGGSVGVALETGSTDHAGIITITTGNASVGSTGTVTLTFNQAYTGNMPVIALTLVKGATDWGALATARVTTQSLSAPIITWNNSATGTAVALTANTTYKIAYNVVGK